MKERLIRRYEREEQRCFLLLAQNGSISCTLFTEWGLTRAIITSALQELFYDRRLQVTLASILVGARFKLFDALIGGGYARLLTQCRLCGECGSPAHPLTRAKVDGPPVNPEELVQFLVTVAQSTDVLNPQLSTPWMPEPSAELDLEMELSLSGEQDDNDSLSFGGDITDAIS